MACLVSVLLLAPLLLALSDASRIYKSRADILTMLGEKEERLYFYSCEMSTGKAACNYAIDGSTDQEPSQCALSELQDKPWLIAILESPAYITTVTILNMDEMFRAFQDALRGMVVMVSDDVCFRYDSDESFVKRTFPCDAIGDQVTIQSEREQAILTICDLEVHGVMLKFPTILEDPKPLIVASCQQSTVEQNGYCENAFDGQKDPDSQKNPVAVTQKEESPWMAILISEPALIHSIRIFVSSCCRDAMTDFTVSLNNRVCVNKKGSNEESYSLSCNYFGDSLLILSNVESSLGISEVELTGHYAALSEPSKFRPFGCMKDMPDDHDLTQLVSSTRMTITKCFRMCKRLGLKYFATQAGRHCWCGSSAGKYGNATDAECSTPCDQDPNEICGGTLVNSVFEIV